MKRGIAVTAHSKDLMKRDAGTFWLAAKAVIRQPVSGHAAAFGSKGPQRLAEMHAASIVHVTPFCYN